MTSVISPRYARRCRRRARATNPGDSQLDEHFSQYPLSLLWNARQRPQGNGFAAAVVSSSKAPEVCGGGLQRSSGTAAAGAPASTVELSMVMLWLVLHETRGRKGGSGDRAPQSEGCPTGVYDRARAQRGICKKLLNRKAGARMRTG